MDQIISTREVAPRERLAYWREHISRRHIQFDVEPLDADLPFEAEIHGALLGGVVFGYSRLVGVCGERTRAHVAADMLDHYVLGLSAVSSWVQQDGREAWVGPEALVLFDGAKPLAYLHDHDQRGITVAIPRRYLADRLAETEVAGTRIVSATQGVGRLVRSFCKDLPAVLASEAPVGLREQLAEHFVSLVALAFQPSAEGIERARPSVRQLQFQLAKDIIDRRLGDAAVSPSAVAAEMGVSRSYLFKLFAEQQVSFQTYLRSRRLASARTDLMNPRFSRLSISEIGYRNGFNNASHFSRSFTQLYGESPRAYRSRWLPA